MATRFQSKTKKKGNQSVKDPVEVYCRVRPLKSDEESCAVVKPPNVLQIVPSSCSLAYKNGHRTGTQHTFKKVFDSAAIQQQIFDHIAFPLVEDIIQGKNGLLFAYGITNSGKTYTMSGEPDQPGVLPRIMDVIFNTIADVQTPKCVFRPDQFNGFTVFTEAEAAVEASKKKTRKISPRTRSAMPEFNNMIATDRRTVDGVDEDNAYSVFVSYIEIYNNFVYDLLEEPTPEALLHPKPPSSKPMREDASHNMYINGGTEVEVRSTEEAYEILLLGQRKRRVAETQLNHDSSRSHAVFNIRVVQGPLDPTGSEVLQDNSKITVSQLSLVDLAGSERVSRTCNEGDRLREAGNINQSLMVLRNCMEILRENHINGTSKHIPYRDSKLTHLFKNFFDGDGKVRMIVCVSPKAENYDETIHVMKFAEVTQEVVVERSLAPKVEMGLAPGRRREASFRTQLIATKQELAHLRAKVKEYQTHHLKHEKSQRESARLKCIIDGQQQQIAQLTAQVTKDQKEIEQLKRTIEEHKAMKASKEKSDKEAKRLKDIVNTQKQQNPPLYNKGGPRKRSLSENWLEHNPIEGKPGSSPAYNHIAISKRNKLQ